MLTLFIIILFAIAYYTGARRGLVLQIVYTVGYMLSLSSAKKYYLVLAKKLELIVPYPSPDHRTSHTPGQRLPERRRYRATH